MPLGTVYIGEEPPRAGAEPVAGYRLIGRLGSGGHGEVWRAEAPGGFQVAMKFIRLGDGVGGSEVRGLEILRGIRHPNLLVTFGAWQVPGYLVLGMELADRTLWDRFCECVDEGLVGIPRDELIEYFAETAKGIDYLNQARHEFDGKVRVGVQHRDLKPQNILLAGGGVKVGDFGLARQLDQSLASHTGNWTFAYAAPEFFRRQTASQSDQYSLAATYCQLRGGRPPFGGPAAVIMAGHLLLPPDLEMLPEEERPVVARALAKAPKDRWPSCRAFVQALRDAPPAVLTAVPWPEEEAPPQEDEEPVPIDPTEWTTKTFADADSGADDSGEAVLTPLATLPPVPTPAATVPALPALPLLDGSILEEDLPPELLGLTAGGAAAWADPGEAAEEDQEAGAFATDGLIAVLNEPEGRRRGRAARLAGLGLAAGLLLAAGLGLAFSGVLPPLGAIAGRVVGPGPAGRDDLPPSHFPTTPAPVAVEPPAAARPETPPATGPGPGPDAPRDLGAVPAVAEGPRKAAPMLVSTPTHPVEDVGDLPTLFSPIDIEPAREPLKVRPIAPVGLHPGGEGRFEARVDRSGRGGAIALELERAPSGLAIDPASIPEGQDSARLTVKAGPEAPLGTHPARLVARLGESRAEADLTVIVGPAERPSRLELAPVPTLAIRAGRIARLPIRVRREGVEGPIRAHIEGLPEGVVAADVQIPAGADRVEAHLSAEADAPRAEAHARLVVTAGPARAEAPMTVVVEPSPALLLLRRGKALLDQGRADEALAALDRALAQNPEEAAAYTLRGSLYTKKGDYDRAIDDFGEALRRNPHDAAAFNNRGLARRGRGEYHRAIADYNEAIQLDPRDAVVRYNRGMAYHHLGDEVGAIADFDKAIELDPGHVPAYKARAESRARLGDQERAKADREQARALEAGRARPAPARPERSGRTASPKRVASGGPRSD